MRCAQCDCYLDDHDAVMISGTAICPNCARRARTQRKTFFGIWLVLVILFFIIPATVFFLLFLGCCGLSLFSGSGVGTGGPPVTNRAPTTPED